MQGPTVFTTSITAYNRAGIAHIRSALKASGLNTRALVKVRHLFIDLSIIKSINYSVIQLINQSTIQSIDRLIDQLVNRSINYSISQSFNQSTYQSSLFIYINVRKKHHKHFTVTRNAAPKILAFNHGI